MSDITDFFKGAGTTLDKGKALIDSALKPELKFKFNINWSEMAGYGLLIVAGWFAISSFFKK